MQAAKFANEFVAGTKVEMIGVGKDDFRAEFFERFLGKSFNGGLRTDRHEEGSFNRAVRRGQAAAARAGRIGLGNFKRKMHLWLKTRKQDRQERLSYLSVSGEDERHSDAHSFVRRPNDEGYSDGPSRFELLGIKGCESDTDQTDNPETEKIDGRPQGQDDF